MALSFVFALFATFGFCILFHVPLRCMFPAAATGGLGWFVYQLLMELGLGITASVFLAACLVALLADICSRLIREAATVFVIPGILPLVPGSGIYYTMFHFIRGNMDKAAAWGTRTLMIAGAIALGLLVIASVIRIIVNTKRNIKRWNDKRRGSAV